MVLRRSRVAFLRFLVGGQRVIKNSKGGGGAEQLQPPFKQVSVESPAVNLKDCM